MSTTGELIRRMILAHTEGNDDAFRTAAGEFVAEERRKNHHILARDLERILANGKPPASTSTKFLSLLGAQNSDLPKDKERGAVLVDIIEARRSLDDLVLAPHVRESLDRIVRENRQADILRSHGLRPAEKMLFCGPPGCGKTVAAEAVAHALYLPLVLVRFDAVVSSYLGETAANLRKVFDFARTRPMVVLFDEFDAIGKRRTSEEEHGELKRVVNSFLQMLDSFRSETITIAATNHQGLLDSALWRRFDEIIFFDKPDAADIHQLLLRNLRQIGVVPSIRLEEKAKALVGMSHADVERIARDAVKQTLMEDRHEIQPDVLEKAIAEQKSRMEISARVNGVLNLPETESPRV
ncbi:MAG: ATP-dependent zinc metalloprotease FtsH [bacterium]|nr:ATP-dependent zinc metalloprotease FtsH [bacterium]